MIAIQFPSVELAELAKARLQGTYIVASADSYEIELSPNDSGALVTITAVWPDVESMVKKYLETFLVYRDLDVATVAAGLAGVANWYSEVYHQEPDSSWF